MIWWPVLVLVIGLVVLAGVVYIERKGRAISEFERNKIREMWNNVELLMADEREASWAKAVFEADKILDYVLALKRVPGIGLGERLKNGKNHFSNVQNAWEAHKLRNRLAHEVDIRLANHEATRAIQLFKDSLRQLGVI